MVSCYHGEQMSTTTVKSTTQFNQHNIKSTMTYLCECIIVRAIDVYIIRIYHFTKSRCLGLLTYLKAIFIEVPEPVHES